MAKTYKVPAYVHVGNMLTVTLLRAGVKLVGPFIFFGKYPMYLFTVRGRRSETVSVIELPKDEAARVLREDVKAGNPFSRFHFFLAGLRPAKRGMSGCQLRESCVLSSRQLLAPIYSQHAVVMSVASCME